ncbi:Gfo/Idh/MocA family protein [Novosphingobium tardum]|uniref:Gfo/Idh/MocA family protein n=1 Tax=Novosphingobium tardum TaxID=1538021 RepID=A0ABV8RT67_9SPHN
MPIALGLVGVGKIARDQHLPAIARGEAFDLIAMASRDAAGLSDVRFTSLKQMLDATPILAAISLASPPVGRAELAREALLAGKHIMLEKPPCATLGEVRGLEDLAKEKSLTLFATWHSREAAGVEAARAWLADKHIQSGAIAWCEDVRVWHPGQDWIFAPGGLGVFDPGINALSILTAILPGNVSVLEAELETPENRQAPIRARVTMLHQGDARIAAEFDFLYKGDPHWSIDVVTAEGALRMDQGGARLCIDGKEVESGDSQEYDRLYVRFAQLIQSRRSDVDVRPLALVADALLVGTRRTVDAFYF